MFFNHRGFEDLTEKLREEKAETDLSDVRDVMRQVISYATSESRFQMEIIARGRYGQRHYPPQHAVQTRLFDLLLHINCIATKYKTQPIYIGSDRGVGQVLYFALEVMDYLLSKSTAEMNMRERGERNDVLDI